VSAVRACYTTARVRRGEALWVDRHVERLERDARDLGLGELEAPRVAELLRRSARESFGAGDGALRVDARAGEGGIQLQVKPRGLGADPATWRVRRARTTHPGPGPFPGAKLAGQAFLESARREVEEAGVDEVLLFDAAGFLVEGSRSAVVVSLDGRSAIPPAARGGVRSLAWSAARPACPEVAEADVHGTRLADAREIVCLNALRGVRPLLTLDGAPVGDGRPGPLAARLAAALPELSS
jgi:branched-subunit amino acid aminotransferase/4-amino-4-deoxychorismate lyase